MKRVLITGAAGLMGQHIVARMKDYYTILGIDIAENPFISYSNLRYIREDLTRFDRIKSSIDEFAPELVFNCAGMTDVDSCEKDRKLTYDLNVGLVENLLKVKFAKIIHISSDYVFNGENGPYAETEAQSPVDYYGKTKLMSEKILIESDRDYLIIRTNVLFGTGINIRLNYITWLIKNLKQGRKLRIVTDQFNNPIHAGNFTGAAIEAIQSDISGILHIGGADYLSRYEIAIKTAEHFDLNPGLIEATTSRELNQAARRPLKGGVKIDKAKKLLTTRLLPFDEALGLMDDLLLANL